MRRRQLRPGGLHAPNLACVLSDRTVARELARTGDVVDGHLGPETLVLVRLTHLVLALDVRLIVGQQQESKVMNKNDTDYLEGKNLNPHRENTKISPNFPAKS